MLTTGVATEGHRRGQQRTKGVPGGRSREEKGRIDEEDSCICEEKLRVEYKFKAQINEINLNLYSFSFRKEATKK